MPYLGGDADKFGNRYEARWTVKCLLSILKGEFERMRVEPPMENDVEFWIETSSAIQYHQVKRQNSSAARWRISELHSRGILRTFWEKTSQPNYSFIFVSTDPVEHLAEIIDRARRSIDLDEFQNELSKELNDGFVYMIEKLETTSQQLFDRFHNDQFLVELAPEKMLLDAVTVSLEKFVGDNAANAVDVLAQFVLDNLRVPINKEKIIAHLASRRLLVAGNNKLSAYSLPSKPEVHISRASVINKLEAKFSPHCRLIMVKGVDGSGKTTLLLEFIELHPAQCFHFFVGQDWVSANSVPFLRDICAQMTHVLNENININSLHYDQLRDLFARLTRDIAKLGQSKSTPFYLVVDGIENANKEPGRDSILDFIQINLDGLFILVSSSQSHEISVPHVEEDIIYFSPPETTAYLKTIGLNDQIANSVYRACKGLPGYLDQLRREIEHGHNFEDTVHDLPVGFRELLDRDWSKHLEFWSDSDLLLFAITVFTEIELSIELLSKIMNIPVEVIGASLRQAPFLRIFNGNITVITDAHRNFVSEKLKDYAPQATAILINYYRSNPFSSESLEQLPPILANSPESNYEVLRTLITADYLRNAFSKKHDISLLRRDTQIMIEHAVKQPQVDQSTLSKFSLISSLLKTLSEEAADRLEVEALLAVGEFAQSIQLAYAATLPEDRLELLAIIGKTLKEQNGALFHKVISELERIVQDLSPSVVVRERAINIASDLFSIHPQTAVLLLEKVANQNSDDNSLDVLLAVLSLNMEIEKQDYAESIKPRIKDEQLKEFVTANSPNIAKLSSQEVLEEVLDIDNISGKLFLLRSWCNENRQNIDAIKVVNAALEIMIAASSNGYTPSMRHLRQLAEPLLHYDYDQIYSTFQMIQDIKATCLQSPIEESVRLELLFAAIEAKSSSAAMHERLLNIYTVQLHEVQELDVVCHCYARILITLRQLDTDDTLGLAQEILQNLPSLFDQLLSTTFSHFKVTKRILSALTQYDVNMALEYASKLNTSERRDNAYAEILRTHVYKQEQLTDDAIKILAKTLQMITDVDDRDTLVVNTFAICVEKFDIEETAIHQELLEWITSLRDPRDIAFANCNAFITSVKLNRLDTAENYWQKMFEAWARIDDLPERVHIGFNLVTMIAEYQHEKARELFTAVTAAQNTSPLSNSALSEVFINQMSLAIRCLFGLSDRSKIEGEINNFLNMADEIPSKVIRSYVYADTALRCDLNGYSEISKRMVNSRVLGLLEKTPEDNIDLFFHQHIIMRVGPALYNASPELFNQYCADLDQSDKEVVIFKIIEFLLSKRPISDPINAEKNKFILDAATALEICALIEGIKSDVLLFYSVKCLVDSLIYPQPRPHDPYNLECRIPERSALTISRRIKAHIDNVLPDKNNISHQGFVIVVCCQLVRFRDVFKRAKRQWDEHLPSWPELKLAAQELPNIADRILVFCWMSEAVYQINDSLAREFIDEAQNLLYKVGSSLDRGECLTNIAHELDRLKLTDGAKYVLQEAMKLVEGYGWDEHRDDVAANILQAAHSIDPEFAANLTSTIDQPSVEHRLKERIAIEQLREKPDQLVDLKDLNPISIAQAAFKIVESINSGTYRTLLASEISQWLEVSSRLPFNLSFPIRMLEIQNSLGHVSANKRHINRSADEMYRNIMETLQLVGGLGAEMFEQRVLREATGENIVPTSLTPYPVNSAEELHLFLEKGLTEANPANLAVYDPEFSPQNLLVFTPIANRTRITIYTTWYAAGKQIDDRTIEELYRKAWAEFAEYTPIEILVCLIETEEHKSPISRRCYICDKMKGQEIISSRSYLEKGFAHIRSLSAEEANELTEELQHTIEDTKLNRIYEDAALATYTFQI